MERIGIYGGSFNPPHMGHIRAAKAAVEALCLDKLLWMPAFQSPDKSVPEVSAQHRLQMARLCVEGKMEVSDLEISRGGVSYTVDTLRQIRAQYPNAQLFLCMGTDMFLSFDRWKEPEQITKLASLAVFYRHGREEAEKLTLQKKSLEDRGAEVIFIENPVTEISSTDLRRLLVFRCAKPFLSEKVYDYILENGLYGTAEDYTQLPMERLEQVVTSLLNPNRVRHVLGCRDTAAELARIWGANETDAARAGMLHDITKALSGSQQLTLCRQYDIILSDFAEKNPKTLHANTGALVARRIFGENQAVVDAIDSHTTGKGNMNTLEKIIYVADYMEPNRDFPGVEELRRLAYTNLDKALKLGLEMTLAVLHSRGSEISPESQEALRYLDRVGV